MWDFVVAIVDFLSGIPPRRISVSDRYKMKKELAKRRTREIRDRASASQQNPKD
jgi:hypothetical protein